MNAMRLGGGSGPDATVLTARSPVPILIVDDNSAKRLGLKAILAPLGYLIVEADCGTAALRCVLAQDFAVILLDVCMPDMDGFETAALIRQRHQSEMTPIIFITAFKSDELRGTDLYAEGAVDFIFAPVPPEELRAKVSVFAKLFLRAEELALKAREVQGSADQLRLLTDAAPIGIFQTDRHNRYIYTNPRWSEITGVQPDDAVGRQWDSIMGLQERATLTADTNDGVIYRDELCHRFEMRTSETAARIVLLTSKCIRDQDDGIAGWVGTLADVTAEVGAEAAMASARDEATEASRLKSDFLANMSHEIRTPMNGVIGMTDLLLETDLDSRQRDYAQTVRNSGEALLTIINDILDFSKVEAGKLEIEDVEFNLRAVVDDVVDLLATQAQSKGLELVAVTDHAVPAAMRGDPGRVRQVLTNLVGNAIKFTSAGEVVVRAGLGEAAGTGAETVVRVEVSDTGDGIGPDKVDLIFQPFAQADTSTSRRYGGTGLGLAISSHLVALMGGRCGVSSRLGEGSTFWFTISVHDTVPENPGRPLPSPGLVGVPVLIVDDNATQRSVLADHLTGWGMTVETAEAGEAALASLHAAAIAGRPFEVALVDCSMPGMDGLELKEVINADPALTVRVVLMTGLAQVRELGPAGNAGVCAWLSKPVHHDDLRACLETALIRPDEPVAFAVVAKHGPSGPHTAVTGRLLLAEDNLINQKVAGAMLSSAGYQVDMVLNGAAAVEAAATGDYDAILMDCQMPELSGYEATAAIRSREGTGRHTPIIALTAGARREDRERCLAEGMDSYLAKPLSKDALLALVARFVPRGTEASTPSVAADPAEMTIDPAVVEELRLLGEGTTQDFFAELVEQFVIDTEPLLAELRRALMRGDTAAVRRICHSIKDSSDQLGGRRLAISCGLLESRAASGHFADNQIDLQVLETDYQELRRRLREELTTVADVLDPGIVDRLERLGQSEGEDFFGDLAVAFLTEAATAIARLRRAFVVGDAASVVRAAHTLRGASANLGATEMARLCAVLETGASAGYPVDGGGAMVDAVETELGRVRDALGARAGAP